MSKESPCGIDGLNCDNCPRECHIAQEFLFGNRIKIEKILDLSKDGKVKINVSYSNYHGIYVNILDGKIVDIGFRFENKEYNVRFDFDRDTISNIEIAEKVRVGYGEYKKIGGDKINSFILEVLKKYLS